ncbi:MAG: triose-phosphate isomerase [Candidatus Eisenbacteria bacterium]|uniref:Triosephosphate isomerase n=1 Tax=Eiseniibacteriota bacterium TaxID=2212470 RepID=A0A7Y2E7F4_UNCEI|nr:triose-phosphate isomerase [Candidatus Eisenbacteria bacterium]
MRRILVAGNIKMNLSRSELNQLLSSIRNELETQAEPIDVAYFPAAPMLDVAQSVLTGSDVLWGAQNMHWEEGGAFTGECSPLMLRELGCQQVILGHSERRALFGETDEMINRKAASALAHDLIPVVCVGETEAERESGATEVVLTRQVVGSLANLQFSDPSRLVVAYEPVWAIGTGKTASPEQAQEAHSHVRSELSNLFGTHAASGIRILYGGSVKAGNAADIFSKPDVDGGLVGGASLKPEQFVPIIRAGGDAARQAGS